MKIKILKYYGEYHDDFDRWVITDITSWDEVSEEDFKKLLKWVQFKNSEATYDAEKYVIFHQDQFDLMKTVQEYLDYIEKEKQEIEEKKRAIEEKKRAKEEAKLQKLAREKKLKEEEELRLLQELKAKYETNN